MSNELTLHRMRLIIRGALDFFDRDSNNINETLAAQGNANLIMTMETVETALLWLKRMIEDALNPEKQ